MCVFFSIKLIIGILIEFVTYLPLLLLTFLFRKTSTRKTTSDKLKELLHSLTSEDKESRKMNSLPNTKSSHKVFKFPWWFKIVLYLVSFVCMGVSIVFILFKGNCPITRKSFDLK